MRPRLGRDVSSLKHELPFLFQRDNHALRSTFMPRQLLCCSPSRRVQLRSAWRIDSPA